MSYPPVDPYQPQPRSPAPPPVPYSPGPYPPAWQPPQAAYGPPTYVQPVIVTQQVPASGMATASLVVGIIGVLGGWCLLGIPCIIAVILGHGGLAQTRNGAMSGRGQAVAGLILGYLFVAPALIIFFTAVLGGIVGTVDPTPTPSP